MWNNKVLIFILLIGCFIISTCERKFEKVMNVTTGAITVITSNSATVGGQIIDLGEGATQYGHCYAKSPSPTVAALKTQLGVPVSTGNFTSNLNNLEPGTKYYVRAYLNDGKETVYGTETSFYTVSASPPIVNTTAATSVTNTTATLNGTVNANNLSTTVTFEYGLTISYGSTANATPNLAMGDTVTNVNASLTGLSEGTLYHYTVKAVSTGGTVYGSDSTFTTNVSSIPVYVSSIIQNATPGVVEMTYNSTLANIVPATSVFMVLVNSAARAVNSVAISGTEVMLTLASPVVSGDIVTVAYTKPASNPLQTSSGGQAASISAQAVTNNVTPVIVIPVYVSSVVQNATPGVVEMTYNSTLANIVPPTSAFTVMVNSVSGTVNSIAISGTEVMLTLASAIVYGDIVTVAYTKPASNPLQTVSGGQAETISAQAVTNNVTPVIVIPVYVSSAVQNATPGVLEMTYNSTLANIVPATSAFTVMVNSVSRTVNSVAISGTEVLLTLSSAVVYGDIVTVAYTKPASNPLQTSSGGQAASISAQTVTNNVTPVIVIPVYVSSAIQNILPIRLDMTYNSALANIVPATSAFTVMVNSVSRTVNTVTISGTKVMLTLASAVFYGDIVTVAYTKPASNPLQTTSGGQAASISAQPVTNNTLCSAPSAITNAATSFTNTTAILNGTVNANGCSTTITFDYGLTTSYGSTVTAGQSPLTGSNSTAVSAIVSGLISGQTYHFRVRASNSGGQNQTIGNDMTFTTTIKDYDGNIYTAVTIGTQVWLVQNLKTTSYSDGTSIPPVTDNTTWGGLSTDAYCWYNNDAATFKATYGALYNWYAVNTGKLCPFGWHVSSQAEWLVLLNYLGGQNVAGGKLKEAGIIHWSSPNTGATNETGFTALPGGLRQYENGLFLYMSTYGYWWTPTEFPISGDETFWEMIYNVSNLTYGGWLPQFGMSVRCVRDQ